MSTAAIKPKIRRDGFMIRIAAVIALGMTLASAFLLRDRAIRAGVENPGEEKLLYIPSGRYLEVAALGYNQLLADVLWLRTISYFGTHVMSDHQYPWLFNLLDAVTILDPQWSFPFHFAGILLSMEGKQVDEANAIVRRGMDLHPDDWRFPFYIGFNYFHLKNNSVCGAKYIFKASTYPDSPAYLKPLAAKLSAKGNSLENHLAVCNRLMSMTKDAALRKQIFKHCESNLKTMPENAPEKEEQCI